MSGYIYIIRKAADEIKNSPIYKVGKTTHENPYQYLKSRYDNGFKIYNILFINDADEYEKKLLQELNNDKQFKLVEGREMFEGSIEILNIKIMDIYVAIQDNKSSKIITLDTLIKEKRMSNVDQSYLKRINHTEPCSKNRTILKFFVRGINLSEEKSYMTNTHVSIPIDKIMPCRYPKYGQFICSTGDIVSNIYVALWSYILIEFNARHYTFNAVIVDDNTGIYKFSRDDEISHKFISCNIIEDKYLESKNTIILNDLLLNKPLGKNEVCVIGQNFNKKNITIGLFDKHLSLMIENEILYDTYFRKAELSKTIEDPTEDIIQTTFNDLYYRAIKRAVIFI